MHIKIPLLNGSDEPCLWNKTKVKPSVCHGVHSEDQSTIQTSVYLRTPVDNETMASLTTDQQSTVDDQRFEQKYRHCLVSWCDPTFFVSSRHRIRIQFVGISKPPPTVKFCTCRMPPLSIKRSLPISINCVLRQSVFELTETLRRILLQF